MILLTTLDLKERQNFNTYFEHQFVFSYHTKKLGLWRVQFTKSLEEEKIKLTTGDNGKLLLEKTGVVVPQKITSPSGTLVT